MVISAIPTNSLWNVNHTTTPTTGPGVSTSLSATGNNVTGNTVVIDMSTVTNLMKHSLFTGIDIGDGRRIVQDGDEFFVEYTHGKDILRKQMRKLHQGAIDFREDDHILGEGVVLRLKNGDIIHLNKEGNLEVQTYVNARKDLIDVSSTSRGIYESLAFCSFNDIHIPDQSNAETKLTLPNGTVVKINHDDTVVIDDSDARTLYKSPPSRGFNRYLNGSDLLEGFIGYCADQGLSKKEFTQLPIELFIYWLVVEAARSDGDPVDDTLPLLESAVSKVKIVYHRCKCCGKFLSTKYKQKNIDFCSSEHFAIFMERQLHDEH